jgi:hypothetical protein
MKKVGILQPGYLPWLGFFDQLYQCDIFVFLDDVQYTKHDWRNRNRIKIPEGILWLSIPVLTKGKLDQKISDARIDKKRLWQKKHLKRFESFYKKAKYFDEIIDLMYDIYHKEYTFLIDVDMDFILKVHRYLSIKTEILFSSEIQITGIKDEKVLSICQYLNATHYLSGDAARDYLREDIFSSEGIIVEWQNYRHPYYDQLWKKEQGFISHLSIIDLLFNHGTDSLEILTGEKVIRQPDGIICRNANDIK